MEKATLTPFSYRGRGSAFSNQNTSCSPFSFRFVSELVMGAEVVGFVALDVDEAEGVGFTTLLALVCLVVATFLDGGFL